MKLLFQNKTGMKIFYQLPEFEKELKKLAKKYPTLPDDIDDIKPILLESKTGIGKNFTIIASYENIQIVKVRILCESLRARTIRLIYAYHADKIEFMYLEVYFKGKKENEDQDRISDYINNQKNI
jgi:hypothetical protein